MPPPTATEIATYGDVNLAQLLNRVVDELKKRKGPVETFDIILLAFGT